MIGPFERTLALRYLRGAEGRDARRGFLRFVVLAAVGGVAVGTGALLLAVMIVRGFSREIEAKIVGFGQDVQVESFLGGPLEDAAPLVSRLEAIPSVERATPAVVDFALLRASGEGGASQVDGVLVWGTEADAQPFVTDKLGSGGFSFAPDANGLPGLVVGARLAERLGLDVGERVTAFSTRGLGGGEVTSRPYIKQFHVAGTYETGLGDFDDNYAFVSLGSARELFRLGSGDVTRVDLTLDDRTQARAVSDAVDAEIGPPVYARPIEDVYRGLFAWVELQQSIVPLVISILVIVAAFNIVGALLMVVLEKAQEIGTVLAMGASRAAVRRLFVVFGFLVGVIGATGGAAVALLLGWIQTEFSLIKLPPDAYYLSVAPVEVRLLDVAVTVAAAVVLCTLAAYVPARAASRVEPIQVIRFGG